MTLNLIKVAFVFNSVSAGFGGLLINFFENYLPASFSKLYRHGKFCSNFKDALLDKCEVPKRYFKHFYAFAGPLSTLTLFLLFHRYYFNGKLPSPVLKLLNSFLGEPLQILIPAENVFLAMIVFTIHCWKRFYESHYISVFSDVSMNFSVYLIGLFHYFGTMVSIVGEAQGFLRDSKFSLEWSNLTLLDYSFSVLILLSTYMQYRTNIILSNLRKDKSGVVVTKKYKIPRGELFEYITAPLQFTEIIIYLSLLVILRNGSMIYYVAIWVLINQMECAYLSHEWSVKTFENYPESRKIIIPYVF